MRRAPLVKAFWSLALTLILSSAASENSASPRKVSLAAAVATDYHWVLAIPPGKGNWPRWNMPVVGFGDKLWAVQESKHVWSSADGIDWHRFESNAGWGERYLAAVAFFDGRLWVLGGRNGPVRNADFRNDVWYSTNGTDWTLATANAGWSPRAGHTALVFHNKLWVIGGGGRRGANDVWFTSDGVVWTQATPSIPWSPLFSGGIFVFAGRIWVIGFHNGDDVWSSADGATWTMATAHAGWGSDFYKTAQVFDGWIWVTGGADDKGDFRNDVWASRDGVHWEQVTTHASWSPRATNYSAVFQNKLWIFGGKNARDDVWYLTGK